MAANKVGQVNLGIDLDEKKGRITNANGDEAHVSKFKH